MCVCGAVGPVPSFPGWSLVLGSGHQSLCRVLHNSSPPPLHCVCCGSKQRPLGRCVLIGWREALALRRFIYQPNVFPVCLSKCLFLRNRACSCENTTVLMKGLEAGEVEVSDAADFPETRRRAAHQAVAAPSSQNAPGETL